MKQKTLKDFNDQAVSDNIFPERFAGKPIDLQIEIIQTVLGDGEIDRQGVIARRDDALKKAGETQKYYSLFRERANAAINKGNFEDAITIIQSELIAENRAQSIDYATLGNYYILSKQFDKSEKTLNEAIAKDPTDINLQLQLAHLYLFTNRVSEAKDIHKKYKDQNVNAKTSWIQQTNKDFDLFKKCHLPEDNFKKIMRVLE